MRTRYLLAAVTAAALAGIPITAAAQASDLGKREYESNCAVCHGKTGKGDGPYVEMLSSRASDLTTLAKRNGGTYPFARVYELIDGTQTVKSHGPRDMPIWGADYQIKAAEYYGDMPYNPQVYVRGRILALTEYLARLQAK
jgi:mono/diheme cytochrome c family protein